MDLKSLRMFVEVIRQGGFSSAAKLVFATQSTVSKAVKALENELDLVLVDRNRQGAAPTAAGEIVYRRALSMLAERDDLIAELDELRGLKRGVLRLGLPPVGSNTLFAPLFAQYRSLYPGIDIRLAEHGSKRLEELLLAGEIDMGGVLLPVSDDFDWQEVHRDRIVAIVATDHPVTAVQAPISAFADHPFILFEQGFALNPIILDACARIGMTPHIAARSSQIEFIFALAAAGLGTGFLPRMMVEARRHEGVRIVELTDEDLVWHMALAWRRGAYLSEAARAWLRVVRGDTP